MAHAASKAAARVDLLRALRAAAITALIAFGLLLPLIGFNTVQNIHNELVLETRWPLLGTMITIIAACTPIVNSSCRSVRTIGPIPGPKPMPMDCSSRGKIIGSADR